MKLIINNWYNISVYFSGVAILIALLYPVNINQKLILASISILFLHFFEKFGFPGGFPWMSVKVLLGNNEMDSTKWNCNNLNCMFGNWVFLTLIYFLPLILPNVHLLTLSAMIFNFLEFGMHIILFNVRMKTIYNPGLITAVFGLTPISCYYFVNVFDSRLFIWYDYIIAIIWFMSVFIFCFHSPLYWSLGRKPGYPLIPQSAYGVEYVNNVNNVNNFNNVNNIHDNQKSE
eukprot:jgi/Orpsp1_1/1184745/evm.model.c7180000090821.1